MRLSAVQRSLLARMSQQKVNNKKQREEKGASERCWL